LTVISEMLDIDGSAIRGVVKKLTRIEGLCLYEDTVEKSVIIGIEHCSFKIKPYLSNTMPIVLFGKKRIIFKSLRHAAKMLKKDKRTLQKLIDEGNTLIYRGDVYCIDELFRGNE